MQKVIFTVNTSPTENILGFQDHVTVLDTQGKLAWSGMGSALPNGTKNGESWLLHFGCLAPGSYRARVVIHEKYGRCILIEEAGRVPSRNPNPNHGGAYYLTEVFVHAANVGYNNPLWRGSAGCPTIHRDHFESFMDSLTDGELSLHIVDATIPRDISF